MPNSQIPPDELRRFWEAAEIPVNEVTAVPPLPEGLLHSPSSWAPRESRRIAVLIVSGCALVLILVLGAFTILKGPHLPSKSNKEQLQGQHAEQRKPAEMEPVRGADGRKPAAAEPVIGADGHKENEQVKAPPAGSAPDDFPPPAKTVPNSAPARTLPKSSLEDDRKNLVGMWAQEPISPLDKSSPVGLFFFDNMLKVYFKSDSISFSFNVANHPEAQSRVILNPERELSGKRYIIKSRFDSSSCVLIAPSYEIDGDLLTLSSGRLSSSTGQTIELGGVWKRVK